MDILADDVRTTIDGRPVRVSGKTGPIKSKWQLLEDETVLAEGEALTGELALAGTLSTGTEVTATIEQSIIGPTRVRIEANGDIFADQEGFVA